MNRACKLLQIPATGAQPPPLFSLLPPSLNPSTAVIEIISSRLHLVHSPSSIQSLVLPRLLPFLGNSELSSILLRSQSLPLPSLHLITYLHTRLNFTPSSQHFSLLIHSLTFSRLFSHSFSALRRFILIHPASDHFSSLLSAAANGQCNCNSIVFSLLIKTYLHLGFLRQAFSAFHRSLHAGFAFDAITSNHLLHYLSKFKDFDGCWDVYNAMRNTGVGPNRYTFNIMINVLCKAEDAVRAMKLLDEMEMNGFDPDLVTYNTLINGYCRKGRIDDALKLYAIMHQRGIDPDLVSHKILITGLCKNGRLLDAHQLFDKMPQRGLSPDDLCYGVLASGYCKEGKMEVAWKLIQAMIGCGYLPHCSLFLELVKGYASAGKLLPCLNVLAQLRKHGAAVTPDAYEHLAGALCRENLPDAARNLLKWMAEDGFKPDARLCNTIIRAFCDRGLLPDALSLKDEMDGTDFCPDPDRDTYTILISCLCKLGRPAEAECLMEEMVARGQVPATSACSSLVGGYCSRRELDKAEILLKHFVLRFGFHDSSAINALIKAHAEEDGSMEKAFDLKDRMLRLGFVPNPETCKLLIDGLSKRNKPKVPLLITDR